MYRIILLLAFFVQFLGIAQEPTIRLCQRGNELSIDESFPSLELYITKKGEIYDKEGTEIDPMDVPILCKTSLQSNSTGISTTKLNTILYVDKKASYAIVNKVKNHIAIAGGVYVYYITTGKSNSYQGYESVLPKVEFAEREVKKKEIKEKRRPIQEILQSINRSPIATSIKLLGNKKFQIGNETYFIKSKKMESIFAKAFSIEVDFATDLVYEDYLYWLAVLSENQKYEPELQTNLPHTLEQIPWVKTQEKKKGKRVQIRFPRNRVN